jgi:hypothetical protein
LGNQQYLLACSNGLKMLDIAEQKIKLVDAGFDKEIKKILKYKADTLLFAADGLYKLSNGKIITYQHPMQRLFSFAGSSGIYLHNDTLIFSNDDKIYRIGLQEKQVFNAAYTSLNVLLNGVKAPVTTIELGQNITIAINYINYHQAIQSDIFYKISNGKEWLKAAANGFSIDRLPAGNFTLTIKAVAGNTTWYSKQFVITVVPRWYQTIWFKVAMAVFVFILMVIFFMYLMNRQKLKADKKLAVQKQLSSFESRALRSQMNPHFIFNTLNSINSTVLENETEKASEFIMQFGKLMRQTLDNSQHEYITLDKELEALSIYLKLERQRLDNAFEYTINLDSAMDIADCLVPPLLLQPYVENAIWHGLVHKQPAGKLLIHVHANENQFTITITDNGIGIAKAGELQKHTNKIASYGTNITLQRLKMMNTNNTVEIKEIINTDGTSGGTSVQITIYQKL